MSLFTHTSTSQTTPPSPPFLSLCRTHCDAVLIINATAIPDFDRLVPFEPDTLRFPSGENATELICLLWALIYSVCSSRVAALGSRNSQFRASCTEKSNFIPPTEYTRPTPVLMIITTPMAHNPGHDLGLLALERHTFAIVDHRCAGIERVFIQPVPPRVPLPAATYYVGGVNEAQRAVYDEHCTERYAERSEYHYSSSAEVEEKEASSGSIWRPRSVYDVRKAFVAFDGLVVQPAPPAPPSPTEGPTYAAARPKLGRLLTFERMPGFNGLGRLLVALDQLGLVSVALDGGSVELRPADLTLAHFATRHSERVGELPSERGIENVHAYTYARTFGDSANASSGESGGGMAEGFAVDAHACLYPLEQFWTVNYWHWTTDALPKAILFAELASSGEVDGLGRCKLLAYDFPWTRQYLRLLGLEGAAVYYKPHTLNFACRLLVPTPSALDAANIQQLTQLRRAIIPRAADEAVAAAAAAGIGTTMPLVLVQHRQSAAQSVHGSGRALTNLDELMAALRLAFGRGRGRAEVLLFEHNKHSIAEQVALYQRTTVIIGVHGAGFANTLWAPAGCHVVEIIPIDVHLDFQCGLTPFWHVAEILGLTKHAFIAYAGRMFEPFELPLVEFMTFLRASGVL